MYDTIKAYYIEASQDDMLKWRFFSFLGDGLYMYEPSSLPKALLKAYHKNEHGIHKSCGSYNTYNIYATDFYLCKDNIFDTNNIKHIEIFVETAQALVDSIKNGNYTFETVFELFYFFIECHKQLTKAEAVRFAFSENNRIFNCVKSKIPFLIYDVLYRQEQICLTNASNIIDKRKISYEVII